jgi:hypothetical protein
VQHQTEINKELERVFLSRVRAKLQVEVHLWSSQLDRLQGAWKSTMNWMMMRIRQFLKLNSSMHGCMEL